MKTPTYFIVVYYCLYDAACWCVFGYAGSALGIPASSCDNPRWESWHAWYKVLQAFYRDFYRGNLAPLWKAPQTCTKPPPAWTLSVWHLCWKCSLGKQGTLSLPSIRLSWNLDSSPKTTCCQWAIVRFCHLCAHSKQRRQWLAPNRGFLVDL